MKKKTKMAKTKRVKKFKTPSMKELKKLLDRGALNNNELRPAPQPPHSGIIMEKCPHCGGTVDYTKGGVAFKKCSKCGRLIEPKLIR